MVESGLPFDIENESIINQFRQFIGLSEALLPTLRPPASESEFVQFIREATPLILEPIRASLEAVASKLTLMRRWLVSQDLLRIAGFSYAEDPYTELMAWALHPNTHPESALLRQRAWLSSFPFGAEIKFEQAATPQTQFWTDDGIPDLILKYETFVVIVEAKTGSVEHPTPSGTMQTNAYPDAVRRALELPESRPVYTVYVTPDRRKAMNREAFNATFVEFSLVLASQLDTIDLPTDLRAAYAMLFTHFITCAIPPGIDIRSSIQSADEWLSQLDNEKLLIARMNEICSITKIFAAGVL